VESNNNNSTSVRNANRASMASIDDRLNDSLENNNNSNTNVPRRTPSTKSAQKRMASTHEEEEEESSDKAGIGAGASSGVGVGATGSGRASDMLKAGRASDAWQSIAKKAYKVTRREGFDWRRDLIQKKNCAADSMDYADLGDLAKSMDSNTNLLELHKKKLELRSRMLSAYEDAVVAAPTTATFTSPIMRRYSSSMSSLNGSGGGTGGDDGDGGSGSGFQHGRRSLSGRRSSSILPILEGMAAFQEEDEGDEQDKDTEGRPATATVTTAPTAKSTFSSRPRQKIRRRSSKILMMTTMPEMREEEEEEDEDVEINRSTTPLFRRFPSAASFFGKDGSDDDSDDPDSDPEAALEDLDDTFVSMRAQPASPSPLRTCTPPPNV